VKVVIVGAGQVGSNLARYLSNAGKEVVVIESDPAKCRALDDAFDVVVVLGSGTSPRVLREAGIQDADLFVAVTASDETNLMTVRLAADLLPESAAKMARLRSREYLDDEDLRKQFKVDVVVNPEVVLGQKILRILSLPGACDVLSFERGKVDVAAFRAHADWTILGRPLAELARDYGHLGVMVGAILRGPVSAMGRQKVIIPDGKASIQEGDLVYFLTQAQSTANLSRLGVMQGRPARSVVIAGAGELSIFLAETLSQAGYTTRILLGDPDVAVAAAERLHRAIVLQADPAEMEILGEILEEGVDTYIAATNEEAVNVLTSVLAQKLGVARSIVITQNAAMMRLIKAVDLNIVLNPFDLAAAFVLRNIHQVDVLEARLLAGEDAEAFEFIPPEDSPVLGVPLRDARFPVGTLVAMVVRDGEVIIPRGDDAIQRGDRVIVLSRRGSIPALERLISTKRSKG
jgi:trk system potassium uptake protein TrkA